jgi:hypothetical protein
MPLTSPLIDQALSISIEVGALRFCARIVSAIKKSRMVRLSVCV